jgi:hypothetical protein
MKRCPSCNRTYDDSQAFCSTDATPLVSEAASSSDPEATIAAPPASDLPPAQVATTEQTPSPQQPYQQQPYQQQWTPPQQQQWGAPPASRNPNKIIILAVIGLVIAVGAGLAVYFLTRSSSTSGTSSSNGSSTSTASKRFVGTWTEENRPTARGMRFTEDGKVMDPQPGGREEEVGTYTVNGDKATFNFRGDKTFTGTLESDNRMRIEAQGKTEYLIKK